MERGSIIDAQITWKEEVEKEIERCLDPIYFYRTRWTVDGKPVHTLTEAEKHLARRKWDKDYGVYVAPIHRYVR